MTTNRIFKVKVSLLRGRGIRKNAYRIVEVSENMTLYDFAELINDLFNFDFDHPFGFYDKPDLARARIMFELFVDIDEEPSPGAMSVENSTVGMLFDMMGKKAFFLFDYGDEWWFKIEFLEQREGEFPDKTTLYQVIKSVGKAPLQYPDEYEEDYTEDFFPIDSDEQSGASIEKSETEEGSEWSSGEDWHSYYENTINVRNKKEHKVNLESFIKFFTDELLIPREKVNEVINELVDVTQYAPLLRLEEPNVIVFQVYRFFTNLLMQYKNSKRVINFALLTAERLKNYSKLPFSHSQKLMFPILKLVKAMIDNDYPKKKITHALGLLPYFLDNITEVIEVTKILEYLSTKEFNEEYAFSVVNLFLLCDGYTSNYRQCLTLLESFISSQKINESYKRLVSFFLSIAPALYTFILIALPPLGLLLHLYKTLTKALSIDSTSAFPFNTDRIIFNSVDVEELIKVHGAEVIPTHKQVSEKLESILQNAGISYKISGNTLVEIFSEFIVALYAFIDEKNVEGIKKTKIFDSLCVFLFKELALLKYSPWTDYPKYVNKRVFEMALTWLLEQLPSYKIYKFLDFLQATFEMDKKSKQTYSSVLPDVVSSLLPKLGKESTIAQLIKLKNHSLGTVRERAYANLYSITRDKTYVYDALDDPVTKIRKWAQSILEDEKQRNE